MYKVYSRNESLLECLNYLIDNAYIIFDGNIYRQSIGIPMGTNAGPHVANAIYIFINMKTIILIICILIT